MNHFSSHIVVLLLTISSCLQCFTSFAGAVEVGSSSQELEEPTITLFNELTDATGLKALLISRKRNFRFDDSIISDTPSYVTIHGFTTGHENDWAFELKDTILATHKANVFIVEWSTNVIADEQSVTNDVKNAHVLAEHIANFFNRRNLRALDFANMHFIGHSIGARAADLAIMRIIPTVGYLTALDPYETIVTYLTEKDMPFNRAYLTIKTLKELSSAKFTTVIHTDSGNLGISRNCGAVDIYLNGGFEQPGCENANLIDETGLILKSNCNHNFAAKFFKSIALYMMPAAHSSNIGAQLDFFRQEIHKCFPVAYLCDSHESFLNGYCGSCLKRERGNLTQTCIHAGLPPSTDLVDNFLFRVQFFNLIRTLVTDADANCVFTYRILIGVKSKQREEGQEQRRSSLDDEVFIRIPLSDNQKHSRAVKMSDKNSSKELNYELFNQLILTRFGFTQISDEKQSKLLHPDNLDYRSALVTFKSKTPLAMQLFTDSLDNPLSNIKFIDVWGKNIETVHFAFIQYMSHLDNEVREIHSFYFTENQVINELKNEHLPLFDYYATFLAAGQDA